MAFTLNLRKNYAMWCKAWPNEREGAYALVWHDFFICEKSLKNNTAIFIIIICK